MKHHNRKVDNIAWDVFKERRQHVLDNPDTKIIPEDEKEYLTKYYVYAMKMGVYKNKEYSAVGIMDQNDLEQEAHLAYLESMRTVNKDLLASKDEEEAGAIKWSHIRNSSRFRFDKQIRERKDGVRVPEREMFQHNDAKDRKKASTNLLTQLFPDIQEIFADIEDHDSFEFWYSHVQSQVIKIILKKELDMYYGNRKRNADGTFDDTEKFIVKAFFGIDRNKFKKDGDHNNTTFGNWLKTGYSLKVIARALKLDYKNVQKIFERAMKKLSGNEQVKAFIVAQFMENRVPMTQEMWKFWKKLVNVGRKSRESRYIKHVGNVREEKVKAYKAIGIDIETSHYTYPEYAWKAHGELPKSDELFSDRESAIKSLWLIESDKTIREVLGEEYAHGYYTMYVKGDSPIDD